MSFTLFLYSFSLLVLEYGELYFKMEMVEILIISAVCVLFMLTGGKNEK